ncbi:10725_t:CDS:2, partial [Ambispora leptoticha]
SGRRLTRRFIVTEGIFENSGKIAQLPKLLELKKKFKYRLILDESLSIGTLGKRGAGLTDYYNIN